MSFPRLPLRSGAAGTRGRGWGEAGGEAPARPRGGAAPSQPPGVGGGAAAFPWRRAGGGAGAEDPARSWTPPRRRPPRGRRVGRSPRSSTPWRTSPSSPVSAPGGPGRALAVAAGAGQQWPSGAVRGPLAGAPLRVRVKGGPGRGPAAALTAGGPAAPEPGGCAVADTAGRAGAGRGGERPVWGGGGGGAGLPPALCAEGHDAHKGL